MFFASEYVQGVVTVINIISAHSIKLYYQIKLVVINDYDSAFDAVTLIQIP